MKVFLSWSGSRSRAAAQKLRQWLPDVIQSLDPWMSVEDIHAGTRWNSELTNNLAETRCGLICLTKDNQAAPWVHFEAGALSKTLDKTFVIPYLIDLEPSEIMPGPLTQFQAKRSNEDETWELVCTLNEALDNPLTDAQLRRGFERCWSELEAFLKNLPPETSHQETRSEGDKLTEVLDVVRTLQRTIAGDITPRLETLAQHSRLSSASRESAGSALAGQLRDIAESNSASKTNPVEEKILQYLYTNGPTSAADLIEGIDSVQGLKVITIIEELKRSGRLTYEGSVRPATVITIGE